MKYSFKSICKSLAVLIFLALPSGAFAQEAGTFQECVGEFIGGFGDYIADETSNTGNANTCIQMQGGLVIEREGSNGNFTASAACQYHRHFAFQLDAFFEDWLATTRWQQQDLLH